MAAFLQKSDPWIENTFVHACSFATVRQAAAHAATQPQEEEEFFDSQQEWEQTENTIPAGLLPSQPTENAHNYYTDSPSRQSKIVQITCRGGSGWDGSIVHANRDSCPPYVLLHDGRYSAVAFLSDKAMASIGMIISNTTMDNRGENAVKRRRKRNKTGLAYDSDHSSTMSTMHNRAERAARRAALNGYNITLRNKSLVCITHYTISTIKQCCSSQHRTAVLNSLDIPSNMQQQLQSQLNLGLFMCVYLQGPITVIGGENQGLIGNSVDVHCSVRVRQALKDLDAIAKDENGCDSYSKLMQTLEACHCFYMERAQRKMDRDNEGTVSDSFLVPSWPWESRLKSDSAHHENAAVVQGSVAQFMIGNEGDVDGDQVNGLELDHILGSHPEEDEDTGNQVDVGRTSTGTVLVHWGVGEDASYDNMHESNKNDSFQKKGSENIGETKIEAESSSTAGFQQGDAAELFNNYQYLDDVLDFSQEVGAYLDCENDGGIGRTKANSEKGQASKVVNASEILNAPSGDSSTTQSKERIEKQTSGNAVSFVGIDQMINNESDVESDNDISECPHEFLTQAESASKDAAEIHLDSKRHSSAELTSDGKSGPQSPSSPIKHVEGDHDSEGHSSPDSKSDANQEKSFDIEFMDTQVSITFSQSHNPQEQFSSDEHLVDSQGPIWTKRRVKSRKSCKAKKNRVRYSQVPVESQVPAMSQHKSPSNTGTAGRGKAFESAPKTLEVQMTNSTCVRYDSDDSDSWMKVQKIKPKDKPKRNPSVSQLRSQIAGEQSEEKTNLPAVDGAHVFDCGQDESVAHTQNELFQDQESTPGRNNHHARFDNEDTSIAATSTDSERLIDRHTSSGTDNPEAIASERNKAASQFDMDRFLMRAKRLCKP